MKSTETSKQRLAITLPLFFLCLFVSICLGGCDDDDTGPNNPSASINKIMPLGASRVEGARPEFESFRYELWKSLVDGGWDFDYVGTMEDEASYEGLPDLPFDIDHEGRGGWTSAQILGGVNNWINQSDTPDIVLFSSPGGNDALDGTDPTSETVANINAIIDIFQSANPNVTIIIEQLAPGASDFMTPELTTAFDEINEAVLTIAQQQSTTTSTVIPVDMFTGFNDAFLADDVHYNETGAKFIADRYYSVLEGVLRR